MTEIVTKSDLSPISGPLDIGGNARIGRATLQRLAREGRTEELAFYGVAVVEKEPVPESKIAVAGTSRLAEKDGKVVRVSDYADKPAPVQKTNAEKLTAATGLSIDQIKAVLGIGAATKATL